MLHTHTADPLVSRKIALGTHVQALTPELAHALVALFDMTDPADLLVDNRLEEIAAAPHLGLRDFAEKVLNHRRLLQR
jgi:hypothetical protein